MPPTSHRITELQAKLDGRKNPHACTRPTRRDQASSSLDTSPTMPQDDRCWEISVETLLKDSRQPGGADHFASLTLGQQQASPPGVKLGNDSSQAIKGSGDNAKKASGRVTFEAKSGCLPRRRRFAGATTGSVRGVDLSRTWRSDVGSTAGGTWVEAAGTPREGAGGETPSIGHTGSERRSGLGLPEGGSPACCSYPR